MDEYYSDLLAKIDEARELTCEVFSADNDLADLTQLRLYRLIIEFESDMRMLMAHWDDSRKDDLVDEMQQCYNLDEKFCRRIDQIRLETHFVMRDGEGFDRKQLHELIVKGWADLNDFAEFISAPQFN